MRLEIYCSDDSQDVPHQVPLEGQDPPVDTTQDHLHVTRHRLDNPDSGEEVCKYKTPDQSSKDPSFDDKHVK